MTKHLRFLFVMLLAMIWSGVMFAQKTETITIADYVPSSGNKAITAEAPLLQNGFKIYIEKKSGNNPGLWNKGNNLRFYDKDILHIESSNGDMTSVEFTVTEGKFNIQGMSSKTWSGTPSASLSFTGSGTNKITVIKITYTDSSSSNKTDTKVSFGENSGNTFTFTEGEYTNGTFTTPTATETTGVAGTIAYSSDNTAAISVDASTGALTFNGYGKATITATFTPNDTKKYAESTDSYIVENKVESINAAFYESFNNCDGKAGWSGNVAGNTWDDKVFDNSGWTKTGKAFLGAECIRIGGSNTASSVTTPVISLTGDAILTFMAGAWGTENTTITVSVSDGTLTYGDNTPAKSVNIDLAQSTWVTYSMKISGTKSCKITFNNKTTSYRFFLDEVMVKNVAESGETTTITLNENSESNTIEAKNGVNVTLKRSMVANEWNTICLPFDVTMNKAKAVFGNDVKIVELDAEAAVDANVLSFKASTGIAAATPYLIKPSSVADEYTFENVNITNKAADYSVTVNADVAFKGIYNMVDITKDVVDFGDTYYAAFLGADNKIYKANGSGNKTKGFRAYFAIPGSAAASALRVVIDGTATSIKNIDSEVVESNAPVYNLQGQRVNGNNLTPGIYVKAGKKFVVK